VDQPEDGVEHAGIVRLPLEAHELRVKEIEAFSRFVEEIA
jgi:hypothetical protein